MNRSHFVQQNSLAARPYSAQQLNQYRCRQLPDHRRRNQTAQLYMDLILQG